MAPNESLPRESMASQNKVKTELVNAASSVQEMYFEPSSTVVCHQESYWVFPNFLGPKEYRNHLKVFPKCLEEVEAVQKGESTSDKQETLGRLKRAWKPHDRLQKEKLQSQSTKSARQYS
ncbi:hypothetical protein BpHYR1_037900 [Brachionus plicatilis]|uniref:Uncharacterized protein n=1 Tax=Brachionus plicatilis TaxID=10195 RepID=A0A3M7T3L7_BRAPC|nr:hypothetical protein BpHYR1_037900 [Brachionus plicatilis]